MANATVLPLYTTSKFFYWNGKLTNSLDDLTTAQTVYWSDAPRDENNAIITGGFLMAVRNTRRNPNRTEMMYVPASGVAADGLSATGVIRGLKPSGLDYTAGSSTFVYEFDSGDEVFCAIVPQDGELLRSAIQGIIASGAVNFIMGADAAATVTHKRSTGVGTSVGYVRWDTSTSKAQFSNDGTTWTSFDSVSASNLVQATSADTTPGYLNDKIDVATAGRLTKSTGNPAGNETIRLTLATTSTDAELNKLTGASANVTAANLNTLTAGAASNADALHTHANSGTVSFTAGENLTAGDTVYIAGATLTTLNPDADNIVLSTAPNTVDNGVTLEASNQIHRALLHFDISAQPASVEKAYLKIVVTTNGSAAATDRRLQVSSNTGAFVETTATWNNAPGVNADAVTCAYNVRNAYPDGAAVYFDITTMYNSVWSVNNYGLTLWWNVETAGGGAYDLICGSRTATAGSADYPKLILVTKAGNYGKAFKTSANENVPGFKGIVTTTTSSSGSVPVQLAGVNTNVSGLTVYNLYKAGTGGTLAAATNALDAQAVAISTTAARLVDKRKEYASDILASAATIHDLDASIVTAPAGLMLDNVVLTARCTSSTYDQDGWIISLPTDSATTSASIGMATLDLL